MNRHGLERALQWVRRHERSLARVVLALFCVAWLQAAVVPCAMAAPSMPDCANHCPYCPTLGDGGTVAHGGQCAYPHQPQADGRSASALAVVLPPTEVLAPAGVVPVRLRVEGPQVADPPRIPLPLQFCRYLE
ncbi:MAG: hypothetical protein U1F08_12940 [Steroidobacteraceae bacterium]